MLSRIRTIVSVVACISVQVPWDLRMKRRIIGISCMENNHVLANEAAELPMKFY